MFLRKICYSLFVLYLVCSGGLAYSEIKIGVVDIERVISEVPQTKMYQSQMEKSFATERGGLLSHEKKLKDLQQEKKKQKPFMTEGQIKQEVEVFQSQVKQFYQKRNQFNRRVEKTARENQQKLFKKLDSVFEFLRQNQRFDIILPKDVALAVDSRLDITDKVILLLKKDYERSKQSRR